MPEVLVAYEQFLTARSDRDTFVQECVEQLTMSAGIALRTQVCLALDRITLNRATLNRATQSR